MFEEIVYGRKEVDHTGVVVTQYHCNDCGSVFCTSDSMPIKHCVICGSNHIGSEDSVESKPLIYLNFIKNIEDAYKAYRRKVLWNPLVPFKFKSGKTRKMISKVYLPAFLMNVNHSGIVQFLGGEKHNIVQDRERCVETKKFDVKQDINFDYNAVLLNVSTKVDDKIFGNICSYNYNNALDFASPAVKDCSYIVGDIPIEEIATKGREKISKHSLSIVRGNVRHPLRKLIQDNSVIQFANTKEILVPVYLLNVKYRKKDYQFLMNGETGKAYMKLPVSVLQTIFMSILVFGIVFFIAYLVARYL